LPGSDEAWSTEQQEQSGSHSWRLRQPVEVMKKLLKVLLSAFYGLVMVEVIIMISPFAFYW
jgi:hypothetical protein